MWKFSPYDHFLELYIRHQQLKGKYKMLCNLSNFFFAVDGIISIKTHLKSDFGFNIFLDLAFLLMEEIWNDVPKGSGYILSSISSQKLAVSPAKNSMVGL